jgi:hypothetical protein
VRKKHSDRKQIPYHCRVSDVHFANIVEGVVLKVGRPALLAVGQ